MSRTVYCTKTALFRRKNDQNGRSYQDDRKISVILRIGETFPDQNRTYYIETLSHKYGLSVNNR